MSYISVTRRQSLFAFVVSEYCEKSKALTRLLSLTLNTKDIISKANVFFPVIFLSTERCTRDKSCLFHQTKIYCSLIHFETMFDAVAKINDESITRDDYKLVINKVPRYLKWYPFHLQRGEYYDTKAVLANNYHLV